MSIVDEQSDEQEQLTYSLISFFSSGSSNSVQSRTAYRNISSNGVNSISPRNYEYYVTVWTIMNKHYKKLIELRDKGLITNEELLEILEQHALLIEKDDELLEHEGKVAVMCGGELFIGDTLNDAVAKARVKYGNRPYYSETINLIDIPSLFFKYAD